MLNYKGNLIDYSVQQIEQNHGEEGRVGAS